MKSPFLFLIGLAGGAALGWTGARISPLAVVDASAPSGTTAPPRTARDTQTAPIEASTTAETDSATPAPLSAEEIRQSLEHCLASTAKPDPAAVQDLLRCWSAIDPEAALSFVLHAPRFPGRAEAAGQPLAIIYARSPGIALAWLNDHFNEKERGEAGEVMIEELRTDHPEAALELAFAPGVPIEPATFGKVLQALIVSNPAVALDGFRRLSSEGQTEIAPDMIAAWAAKDPEGALAWCIGQKDTKAFSALQEGLLRACADQRPDQIVDLVTRLQPDPYALLEFLEHFEGHPDTALALLDGLHPDSNFTFQIDRIACDQLSQNFPSAPDRMLALARASLPDSSLIQTVGRAFEQWWYSDRLAAEAWLNTSGDLELKRGLSDWHRDSQNANDPAAVLARYDGTTITNDSRLSVQMAIQRLAMEDPGQAVAWITRNPTQLNSRDLSFCAEMYINHDEIEAAKWASTLPAGDTRDSILVKFATHWAGEGEIDAVDAVVDTITDPGKKLQARFQQYLSLARRDPSAAQTWLTRQNLSDETRLFWQSFSGQAASGDFVE